MAETKNRAKNRISEFFVETFRRRSGSEYSELLTRGLRGDGGVNRKYPWAYIRLMSLIFVLFAIFLLIVRFTDNDLFVPTITVCASTCFNLSFLLLIYELYPKHDLSFMAVCLALLLGGAGANVISQILFNIFTPTDPWLKAVCAGFFEELPKAAAVICVIIISKKSSPLAGFIFGAAVGCGFSIAEDMGYIFLQASSTVNTNITTIINVSLSRGASALCTHTLWTAAIGWAYCHFSRHLANVAFHLVTLLSCGLHIAWDLPLGNLALGFVYAGCTVVALTECVLILHFERRKVFRAHVLQPEELYKNDDAVTEMWEQAEQENQYAKSLDKSDPLYWRHWGNFTLVLAAVLMAVVGVLYCSIPFRETYGMETFVTSESFVDFMQNGKTYLYTENRPYDTSMEGEPILPDKIYQEEKINNVVYRHIYTVSYDSYLETTHYLPYAVYAIEETNDGVKSYPKEDIFNNGELYASFFRVNESVTGYNFSSNGSVTAITYNPAFVRDLTDWKYLSLFVTFAAIFGAAAVCYISFAIKSWRVKKLCSTKDVSSAE